MNLWHSLTNADSLGLYGPGVVAGIAIALVCSVLSPLVVLKRLSFVGQGISHSAFGGIGHKKWAPDASPGSHFH